MIVELRGKEVDIDDELYEFFAPNMYVLKLHEIKEVMRPILVTGDLKTGFTLPDLNEYIDHASEEELKKMIEKGMRLRMKSLGHLKN